MGPKRKAASSPNLAANFPVVKSAAKKGSEKKTDAGGLGSPTPHGNANSNLKRTAATPTSPAAAAQHDLPKTPEGIEQELRGFDLKMEFGPAIGVTRLQRCVHLHTLECI